MGRRSYSGGSARGRFIGDNANRAWCPLKHWESKKMNLLGIWTNLQSRFNRDEKGASLVEYVLLVALIAVVCIVALQLLGSSASTKLQSVGNSISTAGS